MSAPPVRCRLLALESKPRSPSPARPPRRHDFARHHADFQPPHSGHTCLFRGSLWLSKQPHKLFNTIKIVRIIFTHHLFCEVCTVTKPFANRSAVCPVLLRPELHLRRFHRRRCRHIRSACFREFFTCSRVTWPHALRMQALSLPHTSKLRSYRRTTQPSSGPSGSRKSCFLRMLSFSSQPSLWRNVLRLAHCFRASDGTFLDCCDALLFCRRLCRAHKSPALHVAATAPTSLATRSRTLSQ